MRDADARAHAANRMHGRERRDGAEQVTADIARDGDTSFGAVTTRWGQPAQSTGGRGGNAGSLGGAGLCAAAGRSPAWAARSRMIWGRTARRREDVLAARVDAEQAHGILEERPELLQHDHALDGRGERADHLLRQRKRHPELQHRRARKDLFCILIGDAGRDDPERPITPARCGEGRGPRPLRACAPCARAPSRSPCARSRPRDHHVLRDVPRERRVFGPTSRRAPSSTGELKWQTRVVVRRITGTSNPSESSNANADMSYASWLSEGSSRARGRTSPACDCPVRSGIECMPGSSAQTITIPRRSLQRRRTSSAGPARR